MIKVYPPNSGIVNEELLDLLHAAFQERLEQGINFKCSTYTLSQYIEHTNDSYFVVAYGDNNEILGSMTLTPKRIGKILFGHTSNLAVLPSSKGKGIASSLFKETIQVASIKGMNFLTSTTATNAGSSVRLHKKFGFKKFRYLRFSGRSYDSFYYVKPIKWSLFTFFLVVCRMPVYLISYLAYRIKK